MTDFYRVYRELGEIVDETNGTRREACRLYFANPDGFTVFRDIDVLTLIEKRVETHHIKRMKAQLRKAGYSGDSSHDIDIMVQFYNENSPVGMPELGVERIDVDDAERILAEFQHRKFFEEHNTASANDQLDSEGNVWVVA